MNPQHFSIIAGGTELVAPSTRASLSSAQVSTHGNGIELTLSLAIVDLFADDFVLTSDGVPMSFSVAGGGTTWELRFSTAWIPGTADVTLDYVGSQINAFSIPEVTNPSLVTQRGIDLVAMGRSYHLCFDITTHYIEDSGLIGSQFAPGDLDPDLFNATGLTQPSDLDNWMDACEAFGGELIMFTTKHVGGFCMWDSTISSDYCITASTTWWTANGFDITQAFVDRARLRGLRVGFYFSIWDRAFEVANPTPSDAEYTAFIHAQLTELLTNYGTIDEILIDAWAGIATYPSYTKVNKASTLALIRSLQPNITILINDYVQNLVDKDVNLYESGIGESVELPPSGNRFPCRTWITPTNDGRSWYDDTRYRGDYRSVEDTLAWFATATSRQSEIMYNLSPDVTGLIDSTRLAYLASLNP